MQTTILIHKKHALLPDHNEYIIVDTGSPDSYHRLGNICVNGKQYSCETEIPAINST